LNRFCDNLIINIQKSQYSRSEGEQAHARRHDVIKDATSRQQFYINKLNDFSMLQLAGSQ
jgi:hypothetical protein